jgi:hypothetical protein
MTVNLEMKCSSFSLLLTMTDPNPYRVDGFYDEGPKQSPLERLILEQFKKLNWEMDDDISIEIAGSQVYEIEGDGTRWKPNKGTVKYNRDAFIVIKNRDRSPYTPSVAPPVVSEETVTMEAQQGEDPLIIKTSTGDTTP